MGKDISVNDGKGLFDNEGICDKAILICNAAVKDIISGQYLGFCNKINQIAQILNNLKNGIKADRESFEQKIEDLKRMNEALMQEKAGDPAKKDGAE